MNRKKILYVYVLFLLIPFVCSEIIFDIYQPNYDYEVYYEPNFKACSCEVAVAELIIENKGNTPNTYTFVSSGEFSRIYPSVISLEPGKIATLSHLVNIPCDYAGEIKAELSIMPGYGQPRVYTQNVIGELCNNLVVEPIVTEKSFLACTEGNLSVKLYNTGNFDEIYYLSLEGFTGNAYFPEYVFIEPKQSKVMNIGLRPDCGVSGQILPVLNIKTTYTELTTEIPLMLDLIPNYNFTVYTYDRYKVCNNVDIETEILIENSAPMQNQYSFLIDIDWVSLDRYNLTLGPNEQKGIRLRLQPQELEPGEYKINLEIKPLFGEPVVKDIYVEIINCYEYTVEVQNDKICTGDGALVLMAKNEGIFSENLSFEIIGPEQYFVLSDTEAMIEPGEEAELLVFVSESIPEGTYNLVINLEIPEQEVSRQFANKVQVLPLDACYSPEVSPKQITVGYDLVKKNLEITNNGIKDAQYSVDQYDVQWVELEKDEFFLSPGEQGVIPLVFSVPEEVKPGIYPIEFEINTQQVSYRKKVNITVFEFDFLNFISKNKCIVVFILLMVLFVISLIRLLSYVEDRKKTRKTLIGCIIIVILLLTNVLICFSNFKNRLGIEYKETVNQEQHICANFLPEELCESEFYIPWQEDQTYSLNLSDYFSDPDSDKLSYSVSELEDINVILQQDLVTFVPEKNWYGIREAIFTAQDENLARAYSPAFYLHILDTKEFNMHDMAIDYAKYFFFAFLVVLTVLLLRLIIEHDPANNNTEIPETKKANKPKTRNKKKKK
ncbi:hypothetical protein JW930_06305 [Candidatus Woesearchaeota archaeon]|nr:hypothetical protein [Candidatus Woesearchaeota archaeon]